MSRYIGPDCACFNDNVLNKVVTFYADATTTELADITTLSGVPIVGSRLLIRDNTQVLFPEDTAVIYGKLPNGDVVSFTADTRYLLSYNNLADTDVYASRKNIGLNPQLTGPGALIRRLKTGLLPCSILLLGDSTGNETTEWFYQLCSYLAAQFPAYRTTYRLWNDTTQAYDAPTTLGAGSGVDRYATITASSSQNLQCPDSAATSPTGDMSVRCRIRLSDWTPSSTTDIAGKIGSAGNRSWWFSITTSGFVQFNYSTDGTATANKTSSVATGFADGATGWIRADFATATGNVTFYTAPDSADPAWTQLGTTQTGSGATPIFDSTSTTQFVGRTGGTWTATGGRAYAMQVYSGTALVIDMNLGTAPNGATTFYDHTGNVWTIAGAPALTGDIELAAFNASVAGQNVSYANDGTRFPKLTPYPADVSMISYGHNEGTGLTYAGYSTLTTALLAKWSTTGIVPVLQNPETTDGQTQAHIDAHAIRMDVVASLASVNQWPVVDVYRAMIDDGRALSELIDDGTHPSAEGEALWFAETKLLFEIWI